MRACENCEKGPAQKGSLSFHGLLSRTATQTHRHVTWVPFISSSNVSVPGLFPSFERHLCLILRHEWLLHLANQVPSPPVAEAAIVLTAPASTPNPPLPEQTPGRASQPSHFTAGGGYYLPVGWLAHKSNTAQLCPFPLMRPQFFPARPPVSEKYQQVPELRAFFAEVCPS